MVKEGVAAAAGADADRRGADWPASLQALPQAVDAAAAGSKRSVHAEGENWGVTVSSDKGFLVVARSHLDTRLNVATLYALCNHPGGGALLKSRQKHSNREVLVTQPHYKEVRVIQTTKVKELFRKRFHHTRLHVIEDGRDPEHLHVKYDHLESTFFDKFSGETSVRPLRDEASGREVGSRYEVTSYVLPKGCPPWIARAPVLGQILRKTTLHHVKRVIVEVQEAAEKVTAYASEHGVSEMAALEVLCGPTGECEEAEAGKVRSFMFEPEACDEPDSEDEEEPAKPPPSRNASGKAQPGEIIISAGGPSAGEAEAEAPGVVVRAVISVCEASDGSAEAGEGKDGGVGLQKEGPGAGAALPQQVTVAVC
ncbi:hypothetical protein HYH03_002311 [Edaphochlamys debaryana]|uniref:Uncharacterized protein n=1 Tax=Edaphochlamys debaryana TaxID=47281 RepID=A0A835YK38_9CHLO|nr:hypothetical protein HYH03_002311 [Edaphochlamys debaryana]|eukprot:KAG2500030.1 hypothetical protein HYH03_002311 [Edaphochlamys debaryana]